MELSLIVFALSIMHIVGGILAYGVTMAYFSQEYTNAPKENIGVSLIMACFGIYGLVISFIFSDLAKHGLKYSLKKEG